ncbi:MAG TPA: alpha/beta hydrolase [Spirochaetota bacterium]|nr:alpha/beta hydrolase [Spirochaetota bacterium]
MIKREDVEFRSGDDTCAAWYYRPAGRVKSPYPCVVMAHGFGGQRELRLDAYAERFAKAGYAVIVFDYRHFGGSSGTPRQLISIKKQLRDWRAAVKYARSLEEIDPDSICLWGTSFSGGHVMRTAAWDNKIAAVIAQVPFVSGISAALSAGLRQSARLAMAGLKDFFYSYFGRVFYVPAAGEPGSLAALTAPGAVEGIRRLYPDGYVPDERIAARIFLSIAFYSPGRWAWMLKMPLLVQVAAKDATVPPRAAYKAASRAHYVRSIKYDIDHFDIYVGKPFEQAVRDAIDFLNEFLARRQAKSLK